VLENGTLVEGYRIDQLIGQGGMGIVYQATHLALERKVALKVLSAELTADDAFRERFRREGRIQAALDHAHIVPIFHAGESDYGLFLVMRLVYGATLRDLIIGREVDAARALRILAQIADALDTAHQAELVHRDIKPGNILVSASHRDHAYLADFGLTMDTRTAGVTRTGALLGTVDYMAPEQVRGERATAATDIYGLTAVLYESLTGRAPFPKPSDLAVMYAHVSDPPPRVTEHRHDIPAALDDVIAKGMAKEQGERFSTALELVAAAESGFGGDARALMTAPPPITSPEQLGIRGAQRSSAVRRAANTPTTPAPDQKVGVRAEQLAAAAARAANTPTTPAPGAEAFARDPAPGAEAPLGAAADEQQREPLTPTTSAAPSQPSLAPASAPAPTQAARRLHVWPRGIAAFAVLAAALAAAAFLVGRTGGKSAARETISAGGIQVDVPDGWAAAAAGRLGTTLGLDGAKAARARSGGRLVIGSAVAARPSLLPKRIDADHTASNLVAGRDVIAVRGVQAFRYRRLNLPGSAGKVTLIALPAGRRVQVLACQPASTGGVLPAACRRPLRSVDIGSGARYRLVPSAAYANRLNQLMKRLVRGRADGLAAARGARTPKREANALRDVAASYVKASRRLRRMNPSELVAGVQHDLVAALLVAGSAYDRLGSAAASSSNRRFTRRRVQAAAAETRVRAAVAAFRAGGFALGPT
jgi:serine/threonine-protein kinase